MQAGVDVEAFTYLQDEATDGDDNTEITNVTEGGK